MEQFTVTFYTNMLLIPHLRNLLYNRQGTELTAKIVDVEMRVAEHWGRPATDRIIKALHWEQIAQIKDTPIADLPKVGYEATFTVTFIPDADQAKWVEVQLGVFSGPDYCSLSYWSKKTVE